MPDPLAVAMQQAFQRFRVQIETGNAFDVFGIFSYDAMIQSELWGELCAAADAYARAERLPPFDVVSPP